MSKKLSINRFSDDCSFMFDRKGVDFLSIEVNKDSTIPEIAGLFSEILEIKELGGRQIKINVSCPGEWEDYGVIAEGLLSFTQIMTSSEDYHRSSDEVTFVELLMHLIAALSVKYEAIAFYDRNSGGYVIGKHPSLPVGSFL